MGEFAILEKRQDTGANGDRRSPKPLSIRYLAEIKNKINLEPEFIHFLSLSPLTLNPFPPEVYLPPASTMEIDP